MRLLGSPRAATSPSPSSTAASPAPSRNIVSAGSLDVIGSTGSIEARRSLLSEQDEDKGSDQEASTPLPPRPPSAASPNFLKLLCSRTYLRKMGRESLRKVRDWLLDVEMGVVWGVAGSAIIIFVFAAIWYIDPALLTLVLQFRQANCVTENSAFLVGISNCSWTSCRLGCTREVYKCWQVQVSFEFVENSISYKPPWASMSVFEDGALHESGLSEVDGGFESTKIARLYPNVRGCGYPPDLNCEDFYAEYGTKGHQFQCWVSTMDHSIAMTELNLEQAKEEVIFSLIPLLIFILSVLYAFCRLGVFSICNPLKMCPKSADTHLDMPVLTPKKLYEYKKGLVSQKSKSFQVNGDNNTSNGGGGSAPPGSGGASVVDRKLSIPATIQEDSHSEALNTPSPLGSRSIAEALPQRSFDHPRSRPSAGGGGSMYATTSPTSFSSSLRSAASFRRSVTPSPNSGIIQHHVPPGGGSTVFPATPILVKQRTGNDGGSSISSGGRRRGSEHEMVDLREFDLVDADDIVSIRSVGSVRKQQQQQQQQGWMMGGDAAEDVSPTSRHRLQQHYQHGVMVTPHHDQRVRVEGNKKTS